MDGKKIPELFLEQILLDEAATGRREEIEKKLGRTELDRRLGEMEKSNADILSRYPPAEMAKLISARAADRAKTAAPEARGPRLVHANRRPVSRLARYGLPLAAAAAVILSVAFVPRLVRMASAPPVTTDTAVRVKGAPELLIYREGSRSAELLPNGAVAREGDVVQIKYVPAGRRFGTIVSIDGRGAVTLHYPESAGGSTELESGATAALSYAYQLDDAPGFERFFFVTAPERFKASDVVDSARRLARGVARTGALALPEGFEQASVLLTKGE